MPDARARYRFAALLIAASFGGAACGGDSDAKAPAQPTAGGGGAAGGGPGGADGSAHADTDAGAAGPGAGPTDAKDAADAPPREPLPAGTVVFAPIRDIDFLFVIDNSPGMAEEQQALAMAFPALLDELRRMPGGLPNLHIGVISSDMGAGPPVAGLSAACARPGGDRGLLLAQNRCGVTGNARWIVLQDSESSTPVKNFNGDIAEVFSCAAQIGTTGCGYEHQLQAARVALGDFNPQNEGFLRPAAHLAMVFLTDEDDCSAFPDTTLFAENRPGEAPSLRCAIEGHVCNGMHPVSSPTFAAPLAACGAAPDGKLLRVEEFAAYFRVMKGHPETQLLVASIHGWPTDEANAGYRFGRSAMLDDGPIDYLPVCDLPSRGKATAAIRMNAFTRAFGDNGARFSLCAEDLRAPMQKIGEKIRLLLGTSCLKQPVADKDGDPANGVQAECTVVDEQPRGAPTRTVSTPLAECVDGGARPCWRLVRDPTCTESGFKIETDRGGTPPAPGTRQLIRCATCDTATDPRCRM